MIDVLRKSNALRWFREELRHHKALTRIVLTLAVASGVLSDALLPYFTSKILAELAKPGERHGLQQLVVVCVSCTAAIAILSPLRIFLRRVLSDRVRERLSDRLNRTIEECLTLGEGRGVLVGATNKFYDAWDNMLLATVEQLLPLIVGMTSLTVLIILHAPFMLIVAAISIAVAIVIVRVLGDDLNSKWAARTEAGHQELGVFDGLFASYRMRWMIVKVLTPARRKATALRRETGAVHAKAIWRWQSSFQGLANALKATAIIGGVLLATNGNEWVGIAFLLIWSALMLTERLTSISSISEAYGSALAEADTVLRALENTEPKLAPPTRRCRVIRGCGVTITYSFVDEDGTPVTVIVEPPDEIEFTAGVNLVRGPSGCGKSSLLGAIAGYIPYEGSITLGDLEVYKFDVRDLTVYGEQGFDKLGLSLEKLFGEEPDAGIVRLALRLAGYADAPLKRQLSRLSGGQRRRAFLAGALYWAIVDEADVLLLDEPTNDLGEKSIDLLLAGIEQLVELRPNLILVITSHEDRMKSVATNIVEM